MAIITHLRAQGHEAYLAGGCVRDELLGLTPGDYDVATDAPPDRIASLFFRTRLVGAQFGVVQVRRQGIWIEVATFRSDGPYTDRRRPDSVAFADALHDAQRRDFTINALFLDPLAAPSQHTRFQGRAVAGRVIDHVGGLGDLAGRLVRAVGDPHRRLAEDHLRALRAVRFSARLGFAIEPETAGAITRHAGELQGVSPERIGHEIRRMLTHSTRAQAAGLLESLGLDGPALGQRPRGAGQSLARLEGLGRQAEWPLPTAAADQPTDQPTDPAPGPVPFALALAAWMLDRGYGVRQEQVQELVGGLRRALCLSNEERASLAAILGRRLDVLERFERLGKAGQKRLAASLGFEHALRLVAVEDPAVARRVADRVAQLAAEPGGLAPPRWVTGDDLVALGWRPGPRFAAVLEALYDRQLEGAVADRRALLEELERMEQTGGPGVQYRERPASSDG
ncbi:MAG: hypothetical protein KatS3mg103_1427 [Phycisphaerales bacterium]|nr:MAG: hypothetical protein KatS3mg103_1427 [Phycisphaerales bacterium]